MRELAAVEGKGAVGWTAAIFRSMSKAWQRGLDEQGAGYRCCVVLSTRSSSILLVDLFPDLFAQRKETCGRDSVTGGSDPTYYLRWATDRTAEKGSRRGGAGKV